MYYLNDLLGKRVVDGADNELGEVDGLNIVLSRSRATDVYLRVEGDQMLPIRGRRTEFIPLNEIDEIEEDIHIYKEINTLSKTIKEIDMEHEQAYRAKELIGLSVIGSEGKDIGKVKDIGIGRNREKAFLIVEGSKVKDIRGNPSEAIALYEVTEIDEEIIIKIPYSGIAHELRKLNM